MNTYNFILQTKLYLETEGEFYSNKFSKTAVLHFFIGIIDFLVVFNKLFYTMQTNHKISYREKRLIIFFVYIYMVFL